MSKPILFNTEIVKTILDGTKTQFRSVIKNKIIYSRGSDKSTFRMCETQVFSEKINLKNAWHIFYIKKPYKEGEIVKVSRQNIFLKITNVRVERLRDISDYDILAEGIKTKHNEDWIRRDKWKILWNSTAPKTYKWEDNPYIFVYEFERVNHG